MAGAGGWLARPPLPRLTRPPQVDLLRVTDKICSELYRTLSNVRARLRYEVEQEKKTLARLETAGTAPEGVAVQLTAEQRGRLQRIKHVAAALEVSLIRLDGTSMLFCDV